MKRVLVLVASMAAVTLGCRAEPPAAPPDELLVGADPVRSLDPLVVSGEGGTGEALAARQIYEGLVAYDPRTLRPRPALAASWTVAPDARTYTFLVRRGARFHDGSPVEAADVVYSLNRLARAACEPATSPVAGAPSFLLASVIGYAEVAGACRETELAGARAVGRDTVMISLNTAWADLPAILGQVATAIVPEGLDVTTLDTEPVGTGPYRLAGSFDASGLDLERFDGYWGSEPGIERVRMVGYPDEGAAYLDLRQGRLHYAPVPLSGARHARRQYGDDTFRQGVGVYFFGFNLRSERVAPLAFRRGLGRAVDREALATGIFEHTREPAAGFASPALPGVEGGICGELCEFDPEAARRLVAEAYPEGPPEIVVGVSSEGANPAVGEALGRMFAQVGVTARIVERALPDHVEGLEAGDLDLFQFGWIPAYPTLDGLLWPLFRSASPDNHMRYRNEEVDRFLARARGTLAEEPRIEGFREAEGLIIEDAPVLPLLWYRSSVATDPRLRAEVLVDGLGLTSFADLSFEG